MQKFEAYEAYEAYEAMLLMDNCSNHISDDIIAILTHEQIRNVIFAIHTTQIFQILDVMLFDVLKKRATGLETLDEE
jgi:hypothetical protein